MNESESETRQEGISTAQTRKTASKKVCCIAVIAPNNGLSYFRTFKTSSSTTPPSRRQLQEVVYNSLDVLEERHNLVRWGRQRDAYLGCLAVVGNRFVYGSVAQGGYKLIAVVRAEQYIGDEDVRTVFEGVKEGMSRVFRNAFWDMHGKIGGEAFEQCVEDVVRQFGT